MTDEPTWRVEGAAESSSLPKMPPAFAAAPTGASDFDGLAADGLVAGVLATGVGLVIEGTDAGVEGFSSSGRQSVTPFVTVTASPQESLPRSSSM